MDASYSGLQPPFHFGLKYIFPSRYYSFWCNKIFKVVKAHWKHWQTCFFNLRNRYMGSDRQEEGWAVWKYTGKIIYSKIKMRCDAVRCGAVRCGAVRSPVRCGRQSGPVPSPVRSGHVPGPVGPCPRAGRAMSPVRSGHVPGPVRSGHVPGPVRSGHVPGPVRSGHVPGPVRSGHVPGPVMSYHALSSLLFTSGDFLMLNWKTWH